MSAMLTPFQTMMAAREAQPELLDVDAAQASVSADELKHSARWVAVRKPQVYEAIVRCLGMDLPVKVIALAFEVSKHTVRAIRELEEQTLAPLKRSLAGELRRFVRSAMERLNEEVDTMDIDRLPIAMGIAAEKALLLEGQATQIVQHRTGPTVMDVAQKIRELQAEAALLPRTRTREENTLVNGEADLGVSGGDSGACDIVDNDHPITDR